jgi:dipeptidyl aminopeptidase/acylaminoacyl peptidase
MHLTFRTLRPVALAIGVVASAAATGPEVPTIDQIISLKRAGSPAVSPDGRRVAYTIRETNWDDNEYETEIWIADAAGGTPRQLTNARKSSGAPAWSPDGSLVAFTSDRDGRRQVYLIDPHGGEARVLTTAEEGVTGFAWSPDGKTIAYAAPDPAPAERKERDKKYGEFEIVDADHRMTHLHVIDVAARTARRLTEGPYTVGSFAWSPDGTLLAFDHRANPDPASSGSADISIVSAAGGPVRKLVGQDGPDTNPVWSPDGSRVAFQSTMANPFYYYANDAIASVAAGGGPIEVLSRGFDEDLSPLRWTSEGIYGSASIRTEAHLFRIAPGTGAVTQVSPKGAVHASFSFSRDAGTVAFLGSSATAFAEVFVASVRTMQGTRLTDLNAQIAGWRLGTREVISWKSTDGTLIEGVLHKPADFDPARRHPLLFVIHGGPTGISRPVPLSGTPVYPIDLWVAKGALVLEPNYRGSAGYGEKFRALNVRNLGIGDAWDVVSAIDHLGAAGMVDRDRVGAMGWSQGGYISAFLTTHDSTRFRAISVGAGISDWMTYYVNTDIHPFTRQYLKATPWDDPEIYAKTSPITYIRQARAPTLIQHGELDRRVPIPNAYELYQGLQDQGVPVKLVVFKGFGHGLDKPKAARAAAEQNLDWFNRHIWGEKPTTTQ